MFSLPIITLTSDWQQHDYYLATVKGKILSCLPAVQIVDINHHIKPFNSLQAAFVLRNSFHHFPTGSIHLICINSGTNPNRPHLAIKASGHYFIGTDNGIFSLLLTEKPDAIVRLTAPDKHQSTFPEADIFVPTACAIASGKNIHSLGEKQENIIEHTPLLPIIDKSLIQGCIIYFDSYQNAITNITKDLFYEIGKQRPFEILVQSTKEKITKIKTTYEESPKAELLAIFNSLNLLEIAVCHGNASGLFSLELKSPVLIHFL